MTGRVTEFLEGGKVRVQLDYYPKARNDTGGKYIEKDRRNAITDLARLIGLSTTQTLPQIDIPNTGGTPIKLNLLEPPPSMPPPLGITFSRPLDLASSDFSSAFKKNTFALSYLSSTLNSAPLETGDTHGSRPEPPESLPSPDNDSSFQAIIPSIDPITDVSNSDACSVFTNLTVTLKPPSSSTSEPVPTTTHGVLQPLNMFIDRPKPAPSILSPDLAPILPPDPDPALLALNKPIVLPKPAPPILPPDLAPILPPDPDPAFLAPSKLIDRPEPAPNEFSSASLGPAQRLTDLSDSAPPIEPKPPEPLSKPTSMILIDFGINRAFFKTFLVSCGLRPLDPGFDALASAKVVHPRRTKSFARLWAN